MSRSEQRFAVQSGSVALSRTQTLVDVEGARTLCKEDSDQQKCAGLVLIGRKAGKLA